MVPNQTFALDDNAHSRKNATPQLNLTSLTTFNTHGFGLLLLTASFA